MAQKRVVILGGKGVGVQAAHTFEEHLGVKVLGFLNDNEPAGTLIGKHKFKRKVIGCTEDVHKIMAKYDAFVCVAYIVLQGKAELIRKLSKLEIPSDRLLHCVHPTAVVPWDCCEVGPGCIVAAHAQLSVDVTLGPCNHVLSHAYVGHDTVTEAYVTAGRGSCFGSNNVIQRGAFAGINSCTREHVRLGAFCMVGMGAVVLENVPDRAIVVGNPAKRIGSTRP